MSYSHTPSGTSVEAVRKVSGSLPTTMHSTPQTVATSPKFEVTLRKAYGFGSMVMGMIPFDGQSAVFAFPGVTMGAMGAALFALDHIADSRRPVGAREA